MKLKRKLLSLALAGTMCLSLLPAMTDTAQAAQKLSWSAHGYTVTAKKLNLDDAKYTVGFGSILIDGGYVDFYRRERATAKDVSYGIYDLKNGKIVYEGATNLGRDFVEGRQKYQAFDPYTGKTCWGFRDVTGRVTVAPQYDQVWDYSDGMAKVKKGDKIGYVDLSGKLVVPLNYTETWCDGFHEGLAWVQEAGTEEWEGYFIDKTGQKVDILPDFEWKYENLLMGGSFTITSPGLRLARPFVNGYAVMALEVPNGAGRPGWGTDGWGLAENAADMGLTNRMVVDRKGNLTPFEEFVDDTLFQAGIEDFEDYDDVYAHWSSYMKNFIPVNQSGRLGVVDRQGKVIIPFLYDYSSSTENFDEELLTVKRYEDQAAYGRELVIDHAGNTIIPAGEWDGLSKFVDGYALGNRPGTDMFGNYTWDTYVLTVNGGSTKPVDPPKPKPDPNVPSSWAKDQVNAAIAANIVPKSLQSKYTQAATRAEFCALATQLYETVTGSEITDRKTFTDTTDVNVEKMAALGVVDGTGNGKFSPNGTLTREQAATMLARLAKAAGKPMAETAPTFADNTKIASWASAAVGQVQAADIMGGTGKNQFTPKGSYTREQSILTMMRLYNYVK